MRHALILPCVLLCACASAGKPAPDTAKALPPAANALGPQTLEPGECGLFGWDVSSTPRFIFFATPARGLVKLGDDTLSLPPAADFPAPDGRYGPVQLQLGAGEPLEQGRRYPAARMKVVQDDGFTRTVPMAVVESCGPVDSPL